MVRLLRPMILTLLLGAGMLIAGAGCSSSPSDEELAQLEQLKSQVRALEGKVNEAQREKANMEKQIAEKNGKLQQCQADQDAVKKAMGGGR